MKLIGLIEARYARVDDRPYSPVRKLVGAEQAQPVRGLQVRAGLIREGSDAEILERQGREIQIRVIEFAECGRSLGPHVVNGCAVGNGEARPREPRHLQAPSCHRTPGRSGSHYLPLKRKERARGVGGLVQSKEAL